MRGHGDNPAMDVRQSTELLGGLSPAQFMKRHWQKQPLLVRGAVREGLPPLSRAALFQLAGQDDVESRLVQQRSAAAPRTPSRSAAAGWTLRQGPFSRRQIPSPQQPGWTLLVQGVDTQLEAAHALLRRFRFVPDARLDDLMISYASDGGGVGPHLDAYDVFLLQVQGRRRWRIAPPGDTAWVPDVPLKLLANFRPTQEWVLEPGDMLYLPPGWGHDGTAVGTDCMTCSIGFRSPSAGELAAALFARMADLVQDELDDAAPVGALSRGPWSARRYADPRQPAVAQPAGIPGPLLEYAQRSIGQALKQESLWRRALGEWLTEPKPQAWFPAGAEDASERTALEGCRLDRRTRLLLDGGWLFINGEGFRVGGRDARLLRSLADERQLSARDWARLGEGARAVMGDWLSAGWLHPAAFGHPEEP